MEFNGVYFKKKPRHAQKNYCSFWLSRWAKLSDKFLKQCLSLLQGRLALKYKGVGSDRCDKVWFRLKINWELQWADSTAWIGWQVDRGSVEINHKCKRGLASHTPLIIPSCFKSRTTALLSITQLVEFCEYLKQDEVSLCSISR